MASVQIVPKDSLPKEPAYTACDAEIGDQGASCPSKDNGKMVKPRIISAHFEDPKHAGTQLEKITNQKKVELVVATENMTGLEAVVELGEIGKYLEHEGTTLGEDNVVVFRVTGSVERIPFDVINKPKRKDLTLPQRAGYGSVATKYMSHVCFALETDNGARIRDERVLIVLPDGQVKEEKSDDKGEVISKELFVPPGTKVYMMLPDVLEAWRDDVVEFELMADGRHVVKSVGGGTATEIESLQDKDHADHVVKGGDPGSEPATSYRSKDRTLHILKTKDLSDRAIKHKLKIDRLTEKEKFSHFRDAFEDNGAIYSNKGTLVYDGIGHLWKANKGAVCNQLGQFFLAYWYNHNNAHTNSTSTDFMRQLNNDSDTAWHLKKESEYKYRGFSDVVDSVLPAPTDLQHACFKMKADGSILLDNQQRPIYVDEDCKPRKYNKFKRSTSGGEDEPKGAKGIWYRIHPEDITGDDTLGWTLLTSWQVALPTLSVYSYSTSKSDHDVHGGFLIKDLINPGLQTWAADGSLKKPQKLILKGLGGMHSTTKKKPLALMIWPMKPLRIGGYAPQGTGTPEYLTDKELLERTKARPKRGSDEDQPETKIDPWFRQSLPRFVKWTDPKKIPAKAKPVEETKPEVPS